MVFASRSRWLIVLGATAVLVLLAAFAWLPGRMGVQGDTQSILYLAPRGDGSNQLFLLALDDGSEPRLVSEPNQDVLDYAAAPDGKRVVYTVARADGGRDMWLAHLSGMRHEVLVDCQPADCSDADWSPDGRRLVYTRQELSGERRLWWLKLSSGETVPLFSDAGVLAYAGRWSPDGKRVAAFSADEPGVRIVELASGQTMWIPAQPEGEPVWSLDGQTLLFGDFRWVDEQFAIPLLRMDLASGLLQNLSGETAVDDTSPAWSPAGDWVALARKLPSVMMGRQLWLLRPDGVEAHPLTDEPAVHHGLPAWSPDGRELLFQRVEVGDGSALPAIWLLDLETSRQEQVVAVGGRPAWLP